MADVASHLRSAHRALCEPDGGPTPGPAWCRAWTAEVDAGLARLHAAFAGHSAGPPPGRLAVVAVGGYGRGELCPGSDVDALVLTDGLPDAGVAAAVEAIVYPLWDAGLTVGHATRDLRGAVAACVEDVDTATALLDARTVAGDTELLTQARRRLLDRLDDKPWRFLDRLQAADAARRDRHGAAAELLEPHVKSGAGGLRDVQSLAWAAAALVGSADLDALVTTHYLSAGDRARLARAHDRLLAVRVALHLTAGRGENVLTFDRHAAVADRLGIRPADGQDPAATLLREVFLAARTVDHVHRSAWRLMATDAARERGARRWLRRPPGDLLDGGFAVADGVLRLAGARMDEQAFPTRLLEALAASGAALDRGDAQRIRRFVDAAGTEAARATWAWDAPARRRLLGVLWRGSGALDALTEIDDLGLLGVILPEWEALRGRPQRNPYHRYSLDRHALHTALGLADLVRDERWARTALEEVDDRDGLVLGALLHDVGKAHGEPHSETGVEPARAVARRLGCAPSTVDLVAALVRHHLLLPETATRRDLSDPGLVQAVASAVGDRATLHCLVLLAAADGAATGPSAWSTWKSQLVHELATKVHAVLDHATADVVADGAAATVADALSLAPDLGADPDAVRRHLDLLPARYAAAVPPRAVVRHAALAVAPLDWSEVRTRVTPGGHPDGGVDDLDVVARDRPGLFAKVAGVLALHRGSILSAHAFVRDDGVVVDTFQVRRPADLDDRGGRPGSWWASVEGDLVEAVAGRLALRARVARKTAARRRPARAVRPAVEVRVDVQPDASGEASVVEVHAEDDVGVLFTILSALAELELDVAAARIDTVGSEVVDVFYVRDVAGRPLDRDHADEVVLAVEAALGAT